MHNLLTYITWDVSPFLYEGDHFAIGWYGTLWTLGLLGMLLTLLLTFKHDGVESKYALITFIVTLVAVIYCGHWADCLFYNWYYTADDPVHFLGTDWHYRNPKWEHPLSFLNLRYGGFASHGTAIGVILAGWVMYRITTSSMWYYIDRGMLGLCLIAVCVRLANFIKGGICGIETTLPWGVQYAGSTVVLHPTQIYELLSFLLAFIVGIYMFIWGKAGQYKGLLTGVIMTITLLLRIFIEMLKQPQMKIELEWGLYMGQWLSIPMAIFAVWLIFYSFEQGIQDENKFYPNIITTSHNKRKKH